MEAVVVGSLDDGWGAPSSPISAALASICSARASSPFGSRVASGSMLASRSVASSGEDSADSARFAWVGCVVLARAGSPFLPLAALALSACAAARRVPSPAPPSLTDGPSGRGRDLDGLRCLVVRAKARLQLQA